MKVRILLLIVPLAIFAGSAGANATTMACTSDGCADCENDSNGIASCTTVLRSSYCECTIRVQNPYVCILSGPCTYQPASGGGAGGGSGAGSGGGSCTRTPGEWCPSECSSCSTVFWN